MKKIKFLLLAIATVCFIGLYGCKSTPKEEKAAEELKEAAEEVEKTVEEVTEEEVIDTVAVEEEDTTGVE